MGKSFKDLVPYGPVAGGGILLFLVGASLMGLSEINQIEKLRSVQIIGALCALMGAFLLFYFIHTSVEQKSTQSGSVAHDINRWSQLISLLQNHRALYQSIDLERMEYMSASLGSLRVELQEMLSSEGQDSTVREPIMDLQAAIRDYDGAMSEIGRYIAKMIDIQSKHSVSTDYIDKYQRFFGDNPSAWRFPKGITDLADIYPTIYQYILLIAIGALRGKTYQILLTYKRSHNLSDNLEVFETGARLGRVFGS